MQSCGRLPAKQVPCRGDPRGAFSWLLECHGFCLLASSWAVFFSVRSFRGGRGIWPHPSRTRGYNCGPRPTRNELAGIEAPFQKGVSGGEGGLSASALVMAVQVLLEALPVFALVRADHVFEFFHHHHGKQGHGHGDYTNAEPVVLHLLPHGGHLGGHADGVGDHDGARMAMRLQSLLESAGKHEQAERNRSMRRDFM